MKNIRHLFLTMALAATSLLSNAGVITVTGPITANTTWVSSNKYILSGWVYVKNNAVLTINPGTLIVGEKATKGALIIERGSKLMAVGTPNQPIVFTSNEPVGTRTYGDWGGVILLGYAPINPAGGTAVIEGGIPSTEGTYGGNNPNDNSGALSYVRIEFAGIAFQPNNEINGLTCGGVGDATQLDHIQVSYSGDDSYEWFGGNVNANHLVAFRGWDDDFDTDFGYSGKLQFLVAMRDPNIADVSGSNGFESDNDGTGSGNGPQTFATFSNVTVIGGNPTNNSLYVSAARLRRNTRQSLYNSVLMGYKKGLLIDGTSTETNALHDSLQVRNTIIAGCLTDSFVTNNTPSGCPSCYTSMNNWFNTPAYSNTKLTLNSDVHLTDPFNLTNPNFLPQGGSPALSGSDFSNPRLSGFTSTSYVGAFGSDDWTNCWTNFDPNNTTYTWPINNGPSVSIVLNGTTPFCDSVEIEANASGATLYQWYKTPATLLAGATSSSYYAKASGTYYCVVGNAAGCTKQSANLKITKLSNPAVPKAYFSCQTGSNRLYSTTSPSYIGYQWYINGVTINGASFPSITPVQAGNYTVRVTGSNGCNSPSAARAFPITAIPTTQLTAAYCAKRNLSLSNGLVKATKVTGTNSYEFSFTDSATNTFAGKYISNNSATCSLNVITPALSVGGVYYVKVRVINTAKDTSCLGSTCTIKILNALTDGGNEERIGSVEEGSSALNSFPNPASDKVTFEFEAMKTSNVKIVIYDVTGKEVANVFSNKVEEGSNSVEYSTSELNKGVYFVRMMIDGVVTANEKLSVVK